MAPGLGLVSPWPSRVSLHAALPGRQRQAAMRIFVHDNPGHAFAVQLSRWLAAEGHEVLHCYSRAMTAPRGELELKEGDPAGFQVEAIGIARPVPKYALLRRNLQESSYARALGRRMRAFAPDIVISGNGSPVIQGILRRASAADGARFVYWLQDIYCEALRRALEPRLPALAKPASGVLARYEYGVMRRSDAVVAITDDFRPLLRKHGVEEERIWTIENWAVLSGLAPQPKYNPWSRAQGLESRFVFLYSGTLGLKHNPAMLSALAAHYRDDPEVAVVVVSEGKGRAWLEEEKQRRDLDNLVLLDYQPFAELPQVFGAADVVVAILEPFAGVLSVPSKVLSYLCSSRPLLAAIPTDNLAARTIESAEAGLVCQPGEESAFISAAERLREDAALRQSQATAGRRYAERAFDIDRVGGQFVELFESLLLRS